MKLTREEVKHIALLARLGMSEAEVEKFMVQLSNILENFEVLKQVDTSGLPPTAQTVALQNVFRADGPQPSYPVEDVMANAPQREGDFFKIRPVLE
ncbi:MAG: Asp-tRNA(Asn)/Glu-tRNA(Gln) amidotransferase subunit GatC [Chloroflexi bacterium]|nr:Asp-tRNA(Asn)/Glu-tRNA(Gln) amidotransferase subunit GatC [Chloroflexota bacterium]MBM3172210.1 Asp-tRNA(Asn)/Glu-tRNA(Gln) amidotransferase subunit GatC [Chloroflexota bacterium]MBM3174202.1 Asp-tRNA(Asn)/Glu-tRNA(Gln) amidotransferase subunit GatC [Chloroflexota bacterium]MBM4449895.1 Asp-tRNA(Asn)/Glu-tRNA(Gln) amidotransferase subunit GatC [Chloroflexota bacterium]